MTPTERHEKIGSVLAGAFEDSFYEEDGDHVRAMVALARNVIDGLAAVIADNPMLDTTDDKDPYAMALVYLYNAAKTASEAARRLL